MMLSRLSKTLPRMLSASCWQRNYAIYCGTIGHRATDSVSLLPRIQHRNLSSSSQGRTIPLPGNVKDINAIETARFSPQRNRDRTGEMISAQADDHLPNYVDKCQEVESYDCTGTVSLNSAMQSNVPQPYSTKQKAPIHLNMPGGEWSRSDKYISEDMHEALFHNSQNTCHLGKDNYILSKMQVDRPYRFHSWNSHQTRLMSTLPAGDKKVKLSSIQKLRNTAIEYGSTVIVLHIVLSLTSLGICYVAITSGIDLKFLATYLPVEIPEQVGGFVIAYAIHKSLAPVRVSVTVACAPFVVRFLRKRGYLKIAPTAKYYQKTTRV